MTPSAGWLSGQEEAGSGDYVFPEEVDYGGYCFFGKENLGNKPSYFTFDNLPVSSFSLKISHPPAVFHGIWRNR
jgi:hypothetical protein